MNEAVKQIGETKTFGTLCKAAKENTHSAVFECYQGPYELRRAVTETDTGCICSIKTNLMSCRLKRRHRSCAKEYTVHRHICHR